MRKLYDDEDLDLSDLESSPAEKIGPEELDVDEHDINPLAAYIDNKFNGVED